MGQFLTGVNKKAEVGERKKKVYNKFTSGVKVQFGASWVLSLIH